VRYKLRTEPCQVRCSLNVSIDVEPNQYARENFYMKMTCRAVLDVVTLYRAIRALLFKTGRMDAGQLPKPIMGG